MYPICMLCAVALMAVRDINANGSILPRHELVLDIQAEDLTNTNKQPMMACVPLPCPEYTI